MSLFATCSGCGSTAEENGLTDTPATGDAAVRFTHVTEAAGLSGFKHETGAAGQMWFPETVGGGAGFLDYDGDGWLDIVLVGGATWENNTTPALYLYRNNGDGAFTDVTGNTGLAGITGFGMGISVADYDNDGDPDIFLSCVGANKLLRNVANEKHENGMAFIDVSDASGLADRMEWSTSAVFFDANLDGFVDLYVGNYVDWSPENDIRCTMDGEHKAYCTPHLYQGIPGRFYQNDGGGRFIDRTEASGFLPAPGKTLGIAEWDFNRDGWPDLVVANDTQRDLLYMNDGDGTFSERGVVSGLAFDDNGQARAGMGIDVGVVNDTGYPAVAIGHFSKEMLGFYQQTGPSMFLDRASQINVGRPSYATLTFGLLLFDPDLDGDLDLLTANGHIDPSVDGLEAGIPYRQPPQLFLNDGKGRFSEHLPPISTPMVARGLAAGDYDRDGDEDVLFTENGGPVHLLRNDLGPRNTVQVELEASRGNRDALGAQLAAVVDGRRIHRRVRTGSSFLVSSDKTVTIGLGASTKIDTLIVDWPGGGKNTFLDLKAGMRFQIQEDTGITDEITLSAPFLKSSVFGVQSSEHVEPAQKTEP